MQTPYVVNPGGLPRIRAVDCGLKLNQLRCLVARGAQVEVVPWNADLSANGNHDGLFLDDNEYVDEADASFANLRMIAQTIYPWGASVDRDVEGYRGRLPEPQPVVLPQDQ